MGTSLSGQREASWSVKPSSAQGRGTAAPVQRPGEVFLVGFNSGRPTAAAAVDVHNHRRGLRSIRGCPGICKPFVGRAMF